VPVLVGLAAPVPAVAERVAVRRVVTFDSAKAWDGSRPRLLPRVQGRRECRGPLSGRTGAPNRCPQKCPTGCWDRRETGVDSALRAMACACGFLGDGWPSQVRAVDAPASQDVPAWERDRGLAPSLGYKPRRILKGRLAAGLFAAAASEGERCGPDGLWPIQLCRKSIEDPPRSGGPLRRCGRSQAVFTEGVDPGPVDRGSAPEAC